LPLVSLRMTAFVLQGADLFRARQRYSPAHNSCANFSARSGDWGVLLRSCPPPAALGGRRLLLHFAEQHAPVTRSGSSVGIPLFVNRNAGGLRELGGPWSEVEEEPAACRAAGGGHERKGPPKSRSYAMTVVRRIFRFQANDCNGPRLRH